MPTLDKLLEQIHEQTLQRMVESLKFVSAEIDVSTLRAIGMDDVLDDYFTARDHAPNDADTQEIPIMPAKAPEGTWDEDADTVPGWPSE